MTSYPNVDAYTVTYWPGSAGSFISVLIAAFIGLHKGSLRLSKHGNVHMNQCLHLPSRLVPGRPHIPYLERDPIDDYTPIVFRCHQLPDFNVLSTRFPKNKNMIIQYEVDDQYHMALNVFYKIYIDNWDSNPNNQTAWDGIKDLYFDGISEPKQAAEEQIKKYIFTKQYPDQILYPFNVNQEILGVTRITFKDIFENKNKILQVLSELTEKTVTDEISDLYDQYMLGQQSILQMIKS